jgi:hypothetical protein
MPHTEPKRYAVVSCHVERPLDDAVWARFGALQERLTGGFAIASLMRPADERAGEDEARWLERAREATARGPLGHHTHWTSPTHARPTGPGTGERVLAEGRRLRELGLAPTLFCGGGWHTDGDVAEACAELGYTDCTPRATRPGYLPEGTPWAQLDAPARIRLPSGGLLPTLPTTHSLGDLARALPRPWSLGPFIHVYLHDTDLLDRRRRALVSALLPLLARFARPADTSTISASEREIGWADVMRI